ncbi:hypothetical protein PGT21_023462 [Puccinia graminis f. sp. tritici]|uniref:EamA domain-containing protein n=1 Tax=Puccinia graminis f. sp. tritici TaxID=56615 RepID=A0A5B0MCK0_PUCGR|nr:hypothetical protein PGT21_023462 [Puccinia graminis f. sp. tritici]
MWKTSAGPSANRLGCLIIFILITFAYVIQTELTQAVQRTYQKPYFLLFLTHSGYIAILPLHLLILKILQPNIRFSQRFAQLKRLVLLQYNFQRQHETKRFSNSDLQPLLNLPTPPKQDFPLAWFIKRSIQLTLFLALPAMCWYGAVPFADMTSITSIFNTNAAFTYLFAVCFIDSERFETRKTIGVLSSLFGALMISWTERPSPSSTIPSPDDHKGQKDPYQLRLLGISLALLGSIGYALYEVWYKSVIAWSDSYTSPLLSPKSGLSEIAPEQHQSSEQDAELADPEYLASSLASPGSDEEEEGIKRGLEADRMPIDSQLSLHNQDSLLHANLMTTMVGLATLCLLWVPIPLLHWSGIERFETVQDPTIAWMILGIIIMGVLFNAGFMILIGLWGPVIASVGNLCTLVLIAIVDHTLIGAINSPDPDRTPPPFGILSLVGCASILLGFSILNF